MAQKKRTKKVSQGVHGGGGKTRLTDLQRVLMGKGLAVSFQPIGSKPKEEAK